MLRQFWIYLLPEDVEPLLARIDAVAPGLVVLPGRCFRGPAEALRAGVPADLEFVSSSSSGAPVFGAARSPRLLWNRTCSSPPVVFAGEEAGTHCIDERCSEVLTLAVPPMAASGLSPSRLATQTHFVEGSARVNKSRPFSQWVAKVLRHLAASYSRTAASFIHVAPDAAAWVRAGQGRLLYLHQPIDLEGPAHRTRMHRPHALDEQDRTARERDDEEGAARDGDADLESPRE